MNLDLEYFYNHKIGGAVISAGGAAIGTGIENVKSVGVRIYTWHIPPVIIETFQTLSYVGGATVAGLTIWAILAKKYKAWRDKRNAKKGK